MRLEVFGEAPRPDCIDRRVGELEAELAETRAHAARLEVRIAEAERERNAIDRSEARLSAVVSAIEDQIDLAEAAMATALHGIEASVRASVTELLPTLAEHGFLDEVACAATRIARAAGIGAVVVRLAPQDVDGLAERLRPDADRVRFSVTADPKLPAGQVRVDWTDGGADFDREALLQSATELLERALGQRAQSSA